MPPRLSWSKLRPGLIALAVIVAISAGVLRFAGVGRLRGDTVRLYVLTDQARGVMGGTEVWLLGQKVGVVDRIAFGAPSADTTGRVVIAIDVRAADAKAIRRGAPASVRPGANIIGPVVVYLEGGDPAEPPVRSGDTLRARMQTDVQVATARLSSATVDLPFIMADARNIVARIQGGRDTAGAIRAGRGTVGAVFAGEAGGDVARLRANIARLGALASGIGIGAPRRAAASALARADSIRTLLRSNQPSIGRFRRDSTLGRSIASVRDDLAKARAMLERPDGTLQRWRRDSALTRSIADAQREMALLFDDVRRRPLRYLAF